MNRGDRRHDMGQTLAEFAIVFPIFMLIVLAVFDIGRAVFVYNGLTNAAREAARLAIVNQDKDLVLDRAQAMSFGVGLTSDAATTTTFWSQQGGVDDVTANDECGVDISMRVGCIAVVEPTAQWQAITPIVGSIVGPITMTARSELAVEFVCPNPSIPEFDTPGECPKQP
jgi:Flp pilus assembly protein TadG